MPDGFRFIILPLFIPLFVRLDRALLFKWAIAHSINTDSVGFSGCKKFYRR